MKRKRVSKRKEVTAAIFIFAVLSVFVIGLAFEFLTPAQPNYFEGSQAVGYTALSSSSSNPSKIRADVKGSIYETGSNMTVFGACMDGDGYLLPNSTASFTAWYPNGTQFITNGTLMIPVLDPLTNATTGRFRIHVTMVDTIGTYLTEERCMYLGDYALAYGEWQNPEWVKRIGDTQLAVNNISGAAGNLSQQIANLSIQVSNFQSDVNQNFSQVLSAISNINSSSSSQVQQRSFDEIYREVKALHLHLWTIDTTNPVYSLASGVNNFRAVDMLGPSNVHAVSSDGQILVWDGETWTMKNVTGAVFRDVSVIPSALPYAWYVGSNASGDGFISVNGDGNNSIGPVPTANPYYSVKVFQQPNNPIGSFYAILATKNGLFFSTTSGVSWVNQSIANWSVTNKSRISQVVANKDLGVTQGYRFAVVTDGGNFEYWNGTGYEHIYSPTRDYEDVSLVYDRVAYVVGHDTADGFNKVWLFNDTSGSLHEVYRANGTNALPIGVAASALNDVWVNTIDASVFYHYDGEKWDFARFPFSQFGGVIIGFGNSSTFTGLRDMVMSDAGHGYAVGDDGLVMLFQDHEDQRLDQLLTAIQNQTVNLSSLNFTELTSLIIGVNNSLQASMSNISLKLDQMNASLQNKLDIINNNVTFTQLYLETTVTPLINSTYQNTISILVQLGIMQGQLNQSIQLQNQTLQIVNSTDQKVDILLNRSNRIKAWTTQ